MNERAVFQGAALAALVALVAVLAMLAVSASVPAPGLTLQPSVPAGAPGDFTRPTNEYPAYALGYFAADSLFVLSYLMVFVGLYAATVPRAAPFAWVGLGAGILTALLDAAENAYFITYALDALRGVPLTEPDLPLIYVLTNLKWMAAFATLYAFGLALPRTGRLAWLLVGLMLLFPLVGVLGVAWPALVAVRGLFFLIGMPLFAVYFWRRQAAAA
jgi:hypothetical protein